MELPRICGRAHPSLQRAPVYGYGCGIGILGGVEVQPGTLGALFQQALRSRGRLLEATADALADQLDQLLQLAFARCLDALKSGWPIVAIDVALML
jgi:hypothetical protein